MKRALIIFSFLVVLGIGIIGTAYWIRSRNAPAQESPSPAAASETPSGNDASREQTPQKSLADCAARSRPGEQFQCFAEALGTAPADDSCTAVGERARTSCQAYLVTADAVRAHDAERCVSIPDAYLKGICEAAVSPVPEAPADSDADGLSDEDEARLGTDPFHPDTDRDGFIDGDEVKNGYNPRGSGKR